MSEILERVVRRAFRSTSKAQPRRRGAPAEKIRDWAAECSDYLCSLHTAAIDGDLGRHEQAAIELEWRLARIRLLTEDL